MGSEMCIRDSSQTAQQQLGATASKSDVDAKVNEIKTAKYNEVARWRYSELPRVFSRDDKAETYVVTTSNELQAVMDGPHRGMVFVECVMDKYDAPIDLILGGHAIAETDYGPRGPQSAANAQIPLP